MFGGPYGMRKDPKDAYAIPAMKRSRAIIAGELLELEKALALMREQLVHMDNALSLFGVGDPEAVKLTKPYKRMLLFRPGELTSAVLMQRLRRSGSGADV